MAGAIIEAEELGISFVRNRRRRLKTREFFIKGGKRRPSGEEFWALRNVSFQIGAGEAVGIIGGNGTGKSTLLKLIAGVLMPDEGGVVTHGRVSPMLELSGGFSGDLTGRENMQLVASLHGMSKAELREKTPLIIEFAGDKIASRIDLPVRHYSSGMRVRLGFAVIAQLPHPILLVDEVLAVGDRHFRHKCYATIEKMLGEGRTLVLVSHSESDLKRFCARGLYIDSGRLAVDGSLDAALDAYHDAAQT